ncbi:hypothetical protein ZWY2020_037085 [Hordeum vulgare]|nr:hypothetical protein ZWY2020_037085 [Hordeum vulgare]
MQRPSPGEDEDKTRRREDTAETRSHTLKVESSRQKVSLFLTLWENCMMIFDDQDLGFFTNFLGIFIFVLVIAYHFVMADLKYEN